MTDKQIDAAFASKRNLFITGPAGVGKTYRINKFIAENSDLTILMCAPTGIAALNIAGDTMHRLFHIPVPCYESPSFAKGKKGAITQAQLKVIAQADVIVLDEVSMARNDTFSFMVKVIRKAEKLKGSKIRLIVLGDFSQLPPVVKKTEQTIMRKFGYDVSGYAFTTQEWKSCNFKVVELTEVKRQEDREFIDRLNEIRIGNYKNLSYWEQFVNENPDYDNSIVICGTNAEADRINQEYLNNLPGDLKVLQSTKEGYGVAGYVDDIILVKEGAQVIFTTNDATFGEKAKYHNGTFGIIKFVGSEFVVVTINGKDESIPRHNYTVYSYTCKGSVLTKKELGTVKQYPFKIGKAITIHKSQGQTFDNVIISPEIFAAGQLYVALSRVRSPEGFALLRPIEKEYLIIDDKVKKFYKLGYKWDDIKKKPAAKKPTVKTVKRKSTATKSKSTTAKKSTTKSTASKLSVKKKTTAKKTTAKKTTAKKRSTK